MIIWSYDGVSVFQIRAATQSYGPFTSVACFLEDSGISVKIVSSSTIGLYRSLSVIPSDGDKSAQRHLHFKCRCVLWIYFRLKISHFQCICCTQPLIHHWATWSTFVASWLCDWLWSEAFCHYVCTLSSLGKIKIQTRKVTFLMSSRIFHSIVALTN